MRDQVSAFLTIKPEIDLSFNSLLRDQRQPIHRHRETHKQSHFQFSLARSVHQYPPTLYQPTHAFNSLLRDQEPEATNLIPPSTLTFQFSLARSAQVDLGSIPNTFASFQFSLARSGARLYRGEFDEELKTFNSLLRDQLQAHRF